MKMRLIALLLLLATALPARTFITHGPILGRLTHSSVGVWARTNVPGEFHVVYGTSPDRLDQTSAAATTTLERDNTGWVELKGLEANTRYYYRAEAADHNNAPIGTFRTLPNGEEYRDAELNPDGLFNFSFEYACGNNQLPWQGAGHNPPAFATMLRELKDRIHFSIQNGDWLYEEQRMYKPDDWLKQVGATPDQMPRILEIAPTLAGVWENYKLFLQRGANLSAYHRNMPHFFTFDDHEMLNDVWGAGSPGLRDRRATFRDIGIRAWQDYLGWANPTKFTQEAWFGQGRMEQGSDILEDPEADFTALDLEQMATLLVHWGEETAGVNDNALDGVGGIPNAGVYGIAEVLGRTRLKLSHKAAETAEVSYSIGRRNYYKLRIANAEIFLLDTRTHREMHDTTQPDKPGLSMIGTKQREWLLDGMRNSDADFLFVVSSVNFMVPHVGGGKVRAENKDDAWTVFLDERERLINEWDKLGKPVLILTGDLHNSFAIKITDRVWEFASGPHNSQNHWYTDEGNRPPNGPFEYGPRPVDIRWSTFFRDDVPREQLQHTVYTVVQVNNVFNNPKRMGEERWVAFPRPHVVMQYYSGRTGELLYAEAVHPE
jgi:phosphodiesterase/alkaline phosphatase D-like protein